MPLLHIVLLALVQGITEFLPISSNAHLVLVQRFAGWAEQGLIVNVALHVGTLFAVMLYFWRDLWAMTKGVLLLAKGRRDPSAKLAGYLVAATVPVVIAGFLVDRYAPNGIQSLTLIAWATLGFGILLWVSDKLGMTVRRIEHMKFSDAMIIGLSQVVALIPGTSRSGITMTAARFLGLERPESARFSMLLSIPVIVGAGVLEGYHLYHAGSAHLTAVAFLAAGLAFATALVAIFAMMAWLRRATYTPFVIYRILLGLVLLAVVYA